METGSAPRRILLVGLEDRPLAQLTSILSEQNHSVCSRPFLSTTHLLDLIDRLGADVVYCGSDPERYHSLVEAVRQKGSTVPIVVVSSSPSVSEWLDAIEAGAWDYVGAPFESKHIGHVLENALKCAAPS